MFYREVGYQHYFVGAIVFGAVFLHSAKIETTDWVAAAGVATLICLGFGVATLMRLLKNTKDDLRAQAEYAREEEIRREFADRIANVERHCDRVSDKCCKKESL